MRRWEWHMLCNPPHAPLAVRAYICSRRGTSEVVEKRATACYEVRRVRAAGSGRGAGGVKFGIRQDVY